MPALIKPGDLIIHILNVGHGDAIIVGLPARNEDERTYGLVDCYKGTKVMKYMNKLYENKTKKRLEFICATHPHGDHISGIEMFIRNSDYCPREFWDSGFRHASGTYRDILIALLEKQVKMIRVSSGMEWYFGKLRITALSPSVVLRNQYVTYGVDMNNASIVLRLEHHDENVLLLRSRQYDKEHPDTPEEERAAGNSVVILAGNAEFDAWAQISSEYPKLETSAVFQGPLVKKMLSLLNCHIIKVAHHGSKHSAPLDMYEKMSPSLAVISCKKTPGTLTVGTKSVPRDRFPHLSAINALEECKAEILTTDGSYESQTWPDRTLKGPNSDHPGTIMIVVSPGGKPRWVKLCDDRDSVPPTIPTTV